MKLEAMEKLRECLLDLLFPRRCPFCDGVVEPGRTVCVKCGEKAVFLTEPLCRRCGKKLDSQEKEFCGDCIKREHQFDEGAALFEYGCIKDSLYRFKYGGRQEYKDYYAGEIAARLGGKIRSWKAEALVPVPVHRSKLRQRGYNQAGILAEELGKRLGLPVLTNYVTRCRRTRPQKSLNDEQRQNNLKKAFKICRNDVKLDTIIIVDDIYTTGSTIDEMARALKKAGARKIYFIALAVGKGF